jgi:predicted O-methyltransferase YrrM
MESVIQNVPKAYYAIDAESKQMGFSMPSDILTCSLLKTLAATKPNGKFLELGTGTGLSTVWILDGMDQNSSLISIDNDASLLKIAHKHLGNNTRLSLNCIDGEDWLNKNKGQKFDYIFADTWHGKYLMLDEVLEMLNIGGIYIIDDMLPQENWPEGHAEKAVALEKYLENRKDLKLTKLHWATGIIIAIKVSEI